MNKEQLIEKMKQGYGDNVLPVVRQLTEAIASVYEKGFQNGFDLAEEIYTQNSKSCG